MSKNSLPKNYTNEKTGIEYTLVGDYYVPNIVVSKSSSFTLGAWGMRYKNYLKNSNRLKYNMMILNDTLMQTCYDFEVRAKKIFESLVADMALSEGVTEQLKEVDQMLWVQKMNNINNRAREIVFDEMTGF